MWTGGPGSARMARHICGTQDPDAGEPPPSCPTCQDPRVIPDRSHVGFMWSYPDPVPLPEDDVRAIGARVAPLRYDSIHGARWGTVIPTGAEAVVARSIERYGRALRGQL